MWRAWRACGCFDVHLALRFWSAEGQTQDQQSNGELDEEVSVLNWSLSQSSGDQVSGCLKEIAVCPWMHFLCYLEFNKKLKECYWNVNVSDLTA